MKAISTTQSPATRQTLLMRTLIALFAALAAVTALPQKADAGVYIGVGVSVGFPPPPLPVYEQPVIPGPGYIWTPGYWAWDGAEYYWVPGTWILAPFYGALWTPGYWGWDGVVYVFHPGYWGRHVGFYGGVNYGFGYTGVGYAGGYWGPRGFYYNRAVNRVNNVHITNVYNRTVVNHFSPNRVSYNGGRGGIAMHPTAQQVAFAHASRMGPLPAQRQQMVMASRNPELRASVNHGRPPIAATARPGAFSGAGVVAAHDANHSFTPAAFHARPATDNSTRMQPNHAMPLRSANFAPHPATSHATMNASRSSPSRMDGIHGNGVYRPATNVVHAPAHQAYRAPSTAYHPSPAYRPQTYRPQPQYHVQQPMYRPQSPYHAQQQYHAPAYHPASHPAGSAPHEGREPHHG